MLVLGNYRPVLRLARELVPLGYGVIVARGFGEGCCEYSRFVDEHWDHPPLADADAFIAALTAFLEARPEIAVVYPVFEDYVRFLARQQHRLPQDRIYATPGPETVLISLDKTRMAHVAEELGVPTAPYEIVSSRADLLRAGDAIGYPLVVRPQESGEGVAGKKALICKDREALEGTLREWPRPHDSLMVQRYVAGPRYNHYFAARGGRLVRLLETRILETELLDGTGFAVAGRTEAVSPDLRDYSERLAEGLAYTGVGLVQYMVNRERGEVTFVELNPRIVGSHAIAEAMGLELSRLAIDLADKPDLAVPIHIGASGKRYVWSYGAIRGLRAAVANGELTRLEGLRALGRIVCQAIAAPVHMSFRWDDPLPTIMLFLGQVPPFRRMSALLPARGAFSPPPRG